MAKFLSKFQKLNWLEYLIELLIVFLGITIAFYINKQSDIRQLRIDEVTYLNMIQKDLAADSTTNIQIIDFFKGQVEIINKTRRLIESQKDVDSLALLFKKVGQKLTYHQGIRTYHTLVANSEILKIRNLELRRSMAKYYAYDQTFFARYGEINMVKKSELKDILASSYDFYNDRVVNNEEFYELRLANILYTLHNSQIQIIYAYRKANEMISQLSLEVEEELNKLK